MKECKMAVTIFCVEYKPRYNERAKYLPTKQSRQYIFSRTPPRLVSKLCELVDLSILFPPYGFISIFFISIERWQ
jgi:hypothetical protein